jgi:PAS domain S-box-containing protein
MDSISFKGLIQALNAADDGMAILNREGVFLFINRPYLEMFGYQDPCDLAGKNRSFIYPDAEHQRLVDKSVAAPRQQHQWRGSVSGRHRLGHFVSHEARVFPTEDGGSLWLCRRALSPSSDSKSGGLASPILSFVFHELRNPLATVNYAAELASGCDVSLSTEKRQSYLDMIRVSSTRMMALMGRLQVLCRIESGVIGFRPERVGLSALVESLRRRMVEAGLEEGSIRFDSCSVSADDDLLLDRVLLGHAIANLTANALDASREPLTITICRESDFLKITVPERNPASAGDANGAFPPLGRVDDSSQIEGWRFGQTIARLCVEKHGGRVSLEPGVKGCAYILAIPAAGATSIESA